MFEKLKLYILDSRTIRGAYLYRRKIQKKTKKKKIEMSKAQAVVNLMQAANKKA